MCLHRDGEPRKLRDFPTAHYTLRGTMSLGLKSFRPATLNDLLCVFCSFSVIPHNHFIAPPRLSSHLQAVVSSPEISLTFPILNDVNECFRSCLFFVSVSVYFPTRTVHNELQQCLSGPNSAACAVPGSIRVNFDRALLSAATRPSKRSIKPRLRDLRTSGL